MAGCLVVALTLPVLFMSAEVVAFSAGTMVIQLAAPVFYLVSRVHDVGVPWRRSVAYYLPASLLPVGVVVASLFIIMAHESEWIEKKLHWVAPYCALCMALILTFLADTFLFFSSPVIIAGYNCRGRPLPNTSTKICKAFCRASKLVIAFSVCIGYLFACVSLRAIVNTSSLPAASCIVILASVIKQAVMYSLAAVVLPSLKTNFAQTDIVLFSANTWLTFGSRLLVTAVSGAVSISVLCLATSSLELGVAVLAVHATNRWVQKLEKAVQRGEAPEEHTLDTGVAAKDTTQKHVGAITEIKQAEEALAARRRLMTARRQLSSEVMSIVNELFTEFYVTVAAIILGAILQRSTVFTLLASDLTLEQLPLFSAVQFLPEIVDGWLIIAFLRYVGVDWRELAASVSAHWRNMGGKIFACVGPLFLVLLAAIGGQ